MKSRVKEQFIVSHHLMISPTVLFYLLAVPPLVIALLAELSSSDDLFHQFSFLDGHLSHFCSPVKSNPEVSLIELRRQNICISKVVNDACLQEPTSSHFYVAKYSHKTIIRL
jgi:hypothetical protein